MPQQRRLSPEPMAWGDYDYQDRRVTKMRARSLFLDAIAEHRTLVLADLAREPLQAFQTSPLSTNYHERLDLRDHFLLTAGEEDWYKPKPTHDETIRALTDWGERWNISTPWCLAHALETLDRWTDMPENAGIWWGFAGFNGAGLSPVETAFDLHITDMGWSPEFLTWEQYLERVMTAANAYLTDYRSRIEKAAEAMGMARVEQKAKVHFTWLAIYQTSEHGYPTMLTVAKKDQPSLTESGLYQALRSTALFIDLPLRRSTRKGRTAGSGDQKQRTNIVRRSKNTHS